MRKKYYIRPASHVVTLAGESMLFTPSIPKKKNDGGTSTSGSDAESKQFIMYEGWDMEEEIGY